MFIVFDGETCGCLDVELPLKHYSSYSGFIDVVGQDRLVTRFSGYVMSGFLHVSKSGIANTIQSGIYTALVNAISREDAGICFIGFEDLRVLPSPNKS